MNIANIGSDVEKPTSFAKDAMEGQDLGKDAFLRLLTVQLQNQDPLNPVENEAFVAQLAQFSSLESLQNIEQAIDKGNDNTALDSVSESIGRNTAISMIGRRVHVDAEELTYRGSGGVEFGYQLTGQANDVDLLIVNEAGEIVRTLVDDSPDGTSGILSWDGKDSDGNTVPAGAYRFIASAVNGEGNAVTVGAQLTGNVTGIRYNEDGEPILIFDGGETAVTGVTRISQDS